jgi:hypothetical protein
MKLEAQFVELVAWRGELTKIGAYCQFGKRPCPF